MRIFNLYVLLFFMPLGQLYAAEVDSRFQPYKNNDVLIQSTSGGDEDALEVNYSFKYNFFVCTANNGRFMGYLCPSGEVGGINMFISYTGAFDFYMFDGGDDTVRVSKPVINRLSNPGIHFRWGNTDTSARLTWWGIGFEHRSNGQVISADLKDDAENNVAENMYLSGQHEYFDALSRSGNYFIATLQGKGASQNGEFVVSYKLYALRGDEESDITWGKLSGSKTKFSDYDLLHIYISEYIDVSCLNSAFGINNFKNMKVGFDYTVGKLGFKEGSFELKLTLPWSSQSDSWKTPVYVKYHNGPMERLSDYSTKYESLGIGIDFDY